MMYNRTLLKCEHTRCQPPNHTVSTAPVGVELVYNKIQATLLPVLMILDPNPSTFLSGGHVSTRDILPLIFILLPIPPQCARFLCALPVSIDSPFFSRPRHPVKIGKHPLFSGRSGICCKCYCNPVSISFSLFITFLHNA